jgi:DNA (cytosine-5)-methyltransferase 1
VDRNVRHSVKAIDLYAGIGGWSVGLKLAGIDVVASYEWWDAANETHAKNMSANVVQADIRTLPLSDLPKDVDIVVGSPPCTQFSYANRGGSGDVSDGFKDIRKFFEVIDHLKPKFWAMENVPRVANLLNDRDVRNNVLGSLAYLLDNATIAIVDCSDFGTPQKRKRCIAGNFNFDLLEAYKARVRPLSLGDVLKSLDSPLIQDPNYRILLPCSEVTGLALEAQLSSEELRMNRDAKTFHPIYNNMPFPDPLDVASRTITATCTRVSRESVIVEFPHGCGHFRRLSVRERAVAQGFPITYQFHAANYTSQLKMIGNAIPPNVTYAIANAMMSVSVDCFVPTQEVQFFDYSRIVPAPELEPDTQGRNYRAQRSFAAAIPNLRFKSGMRFELNNGKGTGNWSIEFFFGDSKRIHSIPLDQSLKNEIEEAVSVDAVSKVLEIASVNVEKLIRDCRPHLLQSVWIGAADGMHPHAVVDALGEIALATIQGLSGFAFEELVEGIIIARMSKGSAFSGGQKVAKYANEVLVGLQIGSVFNAAILQSNISRVTLSATHST